jgi:ribose 5-phosphate isomerase A
LSTLDETPMLDLTVDGADEFDDDLNLIKGGGGALLREKIVATSSKKMIVIADASKHVKTLGAFPLPIEVVPFGLKATLWKIDSAFKHLQLSGPMTMRVKDGKPFVTDNGNFIVDCALKKIGNPHELSAILSGIPGVVDHGLFIGIAALALLATAEGVKTIERTA